MSTSRRAEVRNVWGRRPKKIALVLKGYRGQLKGMNISQAAKIIGVTNGALSNFFLRNRDAFLKSEIVKEDYGARKRIFSDAMLEEAYHKLKKEKNRVPTATELARELTGKLAIEKPLSPSTISLRIRILKKKSGKELKTRGRGREPTFSDQELIKTFETFLNAGEIPIQAELAERLGVSKGAVDKRLNKLFLQKNVLIETRGTGHVSEEDLRMARAQLETVKGRLFPRAEVRRGIKGEQIDRTAIREIAEEIMSPEPDVKELTNHLKQLNSARAEVRDVIDEIGKAIDDAMKEKREQRANVTARLSRLQGSATAQSIGAIFGEFGVPVLIPGTVDRLIEMIHKPAEQTTPSIFSQVDLSKDQSIADQILGFDQPSLIELNLDPDQLKSAGNPRELFKRFLETASQLVPNENIAVRVHIKGISKLASWFQRNSNDPFSVVINHDDQLIIFNGKIQNFDRFFHIPASIVITSESDQVSERRLMSDFYAANKAPVVFGNDENILAEFLMGAAIALTQQTHEALITYDQETYRLSAPRKLELMLHALAERTKQRREFARAA